MTDRETFLRRVRMASDGRSADGRAVHSDAHGGRLHDGGGAPRLWPVPRLEDVRLRMGEEASERLDRLARQASALGWQVHRVAELGGLCPVIEAILDAAGVRSVWVTSHGILEATGVEARLGSRSRGGRDRRVVGAAAGLGEQGRLTPFAVDAAVTGADLAVAETGTVVLHPSAGHGSLTSVAPPLHIAVIARGQVVEDLDEFFVIEAARLAAAGSAGPSATFLVSGPSITGDIEGALVRGVHGPPDVHMILVHAAVPQIDPSGPPMAGP